MSWGVLFFPGSGRRVGAGDFAPDGGDAVWAGSGQAGVVSGAAEKGEDEAFELAPELAYGLAKRAYGL